MKEELARLFSEAWENHRGCVVGAILGAAVAISILLFGFWNVAFVAFCVCVGLWLGGKADSADGEMLARLREVDIRDVMRQLGRGRL